jgi:hypothetical protein
MGKTKSDTQTSIIPSRGRRKKDTEIALTALRVRVPTQMKIDIQTVVTFNNATITDVFRDEIYQYIMRCYQYSDDPIYPSHEIQRSRRGPANDNYVRFQLPSRLHSEFKKVVAQRGLDMSFLLRKMAEKYLEKNSVERVLSEFLLSCKEEVGVCN